VNYGCFLHLAAGVFLTATLAACGGGGGTDRDVNPASPPVAAVTGPNSFLIFPNPQLQTDGSQQTVDTAYADAYYRAVDPLNERDTLVKFKAKNGFDSGTGTQVTVVFGDQHDLGYGRRMTARRNVDGTLAFFVENYLVRLGPDYAYSTLNLDAAIIRDSRWFIGINAIEFSPGPAGGFSFPKFFNFSSTTGERKTAVDLDGRGLKAMPGPCISCHGGRGDALTPPDGTGNRLFNLVLNTASAIFGALPITQQNRGDVHAHLHAFSVDTFEFATTAPFRRVDQEATLKMMNQWILCSHPLVGAAAGPEDACRRAATANEWGSTAATVIKQAYGGDGMPNATYSDTYVPPSFTANGQTTLYTQVVAPMCRTCHILRGTRDQPDISFDDYTTFQQYSERIKHHVVDFGNMPLAKIVYDRFYASAAPGILSNWLQTQGETVRDGAGALLVPGRPVTSLQDRLVPQGPITLSAPSTRFASTYAWSIVSGPAATLTNANTATPTFNATADGTYVVRLVVGNGTTSSSPATATIQVTTGTLAPTAIQFVTHIKPVLQGACTTCHQPGGNGAVLPPVFYTDYDRDGSGAYNAAVDDVWFYNEIRSRVNLVDPAASALLRKPAGNHHGGALQPSFNTATAVGNAARANYDLFVNWIANGAPF
jgi:hypothetical protein